MRPRTTRDLVMPLLTGGVLMAAYLLLRPYGDQAGEAPAAAMASTWWVVAHVCGVLALAQYARTALRLADLTGGLPAALARWAGVGGLVLVLPYYGAETFALHVLARHSLQTGDASAMALVELVREQPVGLALFVLGLVLLAVSGVSLALAWQRSDVRAARWAAWPTGALVALLLPQYFLPPAGRMAYGVAYLLAAVVLAVANARVGEAGPASRAGLAAAQPVA